MNYIILFSSFENVPFVCNRVDTSLSLLENRPPRSTAPPPSLFFFILFVLQLKLLTTSATSWTCFLLNWITCFTEKQVSEINLICLIPHVPVPWAVMHTSKALKLSSAGTFCWALASSDLQLCSSRNIWDIYFTQCCFKIFFSFDSTKTAELFKIQPSLTTVKNCLSHNFLKFNREKSETIIISPV